jgi:hypothetical protein
MMDMDLLIVTLLAGTAMGGTLGACFPIIIRWISNKLWPIQIPVAEQRGDSVIWTLTERGKRKKSKSGYEVIELKGRKHNIKPPKYSYVTMNKKGDAVYPLYSSSAGEYFPISLKTFPKVEWNVTAETSAKNWGVLEQRRIRETYKDQDSWFSKYGMFLMSAIFAGMVIFFILYFGGKMEVVGNALAGASDRLSSALVVFSNATSMPPPNAPVVS